MPLSPLRSPLATRTSKLGSSARRFIYAAVLLLSPVVGTGSSFAAAGPPSAARTITGAPFSSAGQVTIVHYWATWCAPCGVEMPILDTYYRRHRGQGLNVLAVSIDQGVSKRKLQDATARFAFPVASIDDVKMPRRNIPRGIPVNRVYDRSGRLVFTEGGDGKSMIDMATLERVVTPLLARH